MVLPVVLDDLLLIGSLALSVAVAGLAWRNRPNAGAGPLGVFATAMSVWAGSHLLEHRAPGSFDIVFAKAMWTGIAPLGFIWIAVVLEYTRTHRWTRAKHVGALAAWPAIVVVLIWMPGDPVGLWAQIEAESGSLYWLHIGVSYALLAVGSVLLIRYVIQLPRPWRAQGFTLMGAIVIGWVGSIVSVFELFGEIHLHTETVGLAGMSGLLLYAILRRDLTEIAPIARRTVVEELSAGVLVLDDKGVLVTVNPAARVLLDVGQGSAVGHGAEAGLRGHESLIEWLDQLDGPDNRTTAVLDLGDATVRARASSVTDRTHTTIGWVVLLQDITEDRRRQEALEEQRDRLERFTSIVSHDLRNPLNLATGRVELAMEDCDSDHLELVQDAHGRMAELIDDLLVLAREGERVSDIESSDLAGIARRSWHTIESPDAHLEVEGTTGIDADPKRLQQLLENLFRNAIDHAGTDVTVIVGPTDGGFYVEDDGPGIPESERDEVFDPGYSSRDHGTGLGLTIVKDIAEAHAWEIDVSNSSRDGVRFTFQTSTSP